jgi:hypothetical protein
MSEEPCRHCENIRSTADNLMAALNIINYSVKDVLQFAAYIHSYIRYQAILEDNKHGSNDCEIETMNLFNKMCESEFKELNFCDPMEPKAFDKNFDFRTKMTNGE